MTDDELKAELLERANAGLPRPEFDSDGEHERELAEALRRFTTHDRSKMISGELLTGFDRVTIAVPAIGTEDGIPLRVNGVWDATGSYPAWADVTVGDVRVRINPDIIEAPYFRLADCLFFAFHRTADLPREAMHKIKQRLGETDYLFWREKIGGREVVMVDTYDRLLSWC